MSYYNELIKFIAQAKTGELTTSQYINEYEGLKVKVSFGQGNQARVPWIAFLAEGNTVQHGIYPVYLFFKEKNVLLLSYGVSETSEPTNNWPNNKKLETISEYFRKNELGKPERYGDSYVYITYDTTKPINEYQVNENLKSIISKYKMVLENNNIAPTKNLSFDYKSFQKKCTEAGLQFSDKMILRFVSSLCAKPFVICTGLSGSGKTKLAQSFAQWICNDEQQYKIIPVGADWTNREPLLGYPNSLDSKHYIKPESGVLDLILRAEKYAHLPHFLILDEMNLSHVERYFADFLSCMESGDYLHLHSVNEGLIDTEGNIIPGKLKLPNNLFLIGTVNVDETTYMFSPKVLDRANVIEFRVSDKDLEQYLQNPRKPDMSILISNGADMAVDFVNIAKRKVIKDIKDEKLNKSLLLFFSELKKCGAEFGFRSAAEITRLSAILNLLEQTLKADENIDIAVMQKLLPKLHGSRNKIAKILITLAGFCVKDISDVKKEFLEKPDPIDYSTHQNVIYPLSLEKITRMYHSLVDNGYASYAEA